VPLVFDLATQFLASPLGGLGDGGVGSEPTPPSFPALRTEKSVLQNKKCRAGTGRDSIGIHSPLKSPNQLQRRHDRKNQDETVEQLL
jgi:hypothetical protein